VDHKQRRTLFGSLETIINVVAACTALVALRISGMPADANHPYGHQKAEYFSAVLEGMMVLGAAVAILHEVYNAWHPRRRLRHRCAAC
jgi:divalent metal cation (Fe/Co/Zn/Cd) transporter